MHKLGSVGVGNGWIPNKCMPFQMLSNPTLNLTWLLFLAAAATITYTYLPRVGTRHRT